MIDLWFAILGRKHCGWCIDRPEDGWWNRTFRLNQAMLWEDRRWYEKLECNRERLFTKYDPFWRVAREWHFKFHPDHRYPS